MIKDLHPTDVLAWADRMGVQLNVVEDRIRYAPLEAASPEFVEALREHKPELVAFLTGPLPDGAELADSIDICIQLGQRIRTGEITALRCGITGNICRHCKGIPCFGSVPLEP